MRRLLALLPISLALAACGGGGPPGGGATTGTDRMQTPTTQTTAPAPGY
jgi:hypothetical protein